jgi:hypothetical protein
MHGDESLLYNPEAGEDRREDMARAVAACPVQAITVDADSLDGNPGTDREATGER